MISDLPTVNKSIPLYIPPTPSGQCPLRFIHWSEEVDRTCTADQLLRQCDVEGKMHLHIFFFLLTQKYIVEIKFHGIEMLSCVLPFSCN